MFYKTCVSAGISNHEEYSLVREMTDDEKEKTLTLRRDKSIAKDQKKLEEMRKKLHTDDERTSVSVTLLCFCHSCNQGVGAKGKC